MMRRELRGVKNPMHPRRATRARARARPRPRPRPRPRARARARALLRPSRAAVLMQRCHAHWQTGLCPWRSAEPPAQGARWCRERRGGQQREHSSGSTAAGAQQREHSSGSTAGEHSREAQQGGTAAEHSRGVQQGSAAGECSRGVQQGSAAGECSRGVQQGSAAEERGVPGGRWAGFREAGRLHCGGLSAVRGAPHPRRRSPFSPDRGMSTAA